MKKEEGGSVAEWFVRWTTKLATRVRSRVAAGLPTGYSVASSIGLDWIIGEVMTRTVDSAGNKSFHPYQVGDFRRLSTLNKRPLPFTFLRYF